MCLIFQVLSKNFVLFPNVGLFKPQGLWNFNNRWKQSIQTFPKTWGLGFCLEVTLDVGGHRYTSTFRTLATGRAARSALADLVMLGPGPGGK